MAPRRRISRVQPYHILPTIKKQSPVKSTDATRDSEVKYPASTFYNRPFESRLPTKREAAEIFKETIKLNDGYYLNKDIFFTAHEASGQKQSAQAN